MVSVPDLERLLDFTDTLDRAMQERLTREALLRQALPAAAACIPAAGEVRVYRVADNVGVLEAATDWPDAQRIDLSAETVYGQALEDGGPVCAADRLWVAPLLAAGDLFGLLEVTLTDTAGAQSGDALRLVAVHLAGALRQVALVLVNTRLADAVEHHVEQLERVTSYGQRIQTSLDTKAVLQATLAALREIAPANRLEIALFDAAEGQLRVAALFANGIDFITLPGGSIVPLRGTLAGEAWENRTVLYVPDTLARPEVLTAGLQGLRTLLALPVFSRVGVLGVVTLGSSQPDAYAESDIAVVQQMLGLLASAIENAVVYDRSQHFARNESLINVISERIQQQNDIQAMFDVALTELGQALGARRAQVRLQPPAPTGDETAGQP